MQIGRHSAGVLSCQCHPALGEDAYYRDKDQREIDLLLVQDGIVYPLEIEKTASPNRSDIRHFDALELLGLLVGSGGVICLATESLPLTATAQSIPAWLI